jgi:membrane protein implicated in regulation of membrane protease activity
MKRFLPLLLISSIIVAVAVGVLLDAGSVQRIESYGLSGVRTDTSALKREPYGEQSRPVTSYMTSRLAVGVRFSSLDDLVSDQQAAGYVKVGLFGNYWPATVTETEKDKDEIKFVRQDGTKHHYDKFDGYEMKMVRLVAGNRETIVVFRSQQKK